MAVIGVGLALLLGVVQGLTEFLPISSSGHLRLMGAVFGVTDPQTLFDVCVHGGTLVAVMAFYRREVLAILKSLLRPSWDDPDFRLGMFVLLGTVPAGVVGIGLGDFLESQLASPLTVCAFLIANGFILWMARNAPDPGRGLETLTARDAITIGLAQCVAILRGISRSGSTIVAGMRLGLGREAAAAFSFLLSIPAIGGALLLEGRKVALDGSVDWTPYLLGTVAAGISGYLALTLLVRLIKRGQLHQFAWYCWALGSAGLGYLLTAG